MIDEETVSVQAGSFDCWIIKHIQSEGHQYNLEYFDKGSGLLIKEENWAANQNGEWKMISETSIESFKFGDVETK